MPTTIQRAEKIRRNLAFIESAYAVNHPDELVIAYFYAALHMLECVASDFLKKSFKSHSERASFLRSIGFDSNHILFGFGRDYFALQSLSEQARYLSSVDSKAYDPIVPRRDLPKAKQFFLDLRRNFEAIYAGKKQSVPWIHASTKTAGAMG